MEIQGVKRKHDETESSLPESDKPQDSSKPQDPPESKPQDQNQASPEKQPNNSDPKPETTTLVDRLHAECPTAVHPLPVETTAQDLEALEKQLALKMRQFKWKRAQDEGPYTDLDLQEILNPEDRMESIVLRSTDRHAANNHHLESIAIAILKMIEEEAELYKLLSHLSSIVQGDDPEWSEESLLEDLEDPTELHQCRKVVQEYFFMHSIFLEKMQVVRDAITYIYSRKRELLKVLRRQYLRAAQLEARHD